MYLSGKTQDWGCWAVFLARNSVMSLRGPCPYLIYHRASADQLLLLEVYRNVFRMSQNDGELYVVEAIFCCCLPHCRDKEKKQQSKCVYEVAMSGILRRVLVASSRRGSPRIETFLQKPNQTKPNLFCICLFQHSAGHCGIMAHIHSLVQLAQPEVDMAEPEGTQGWWKQAVDVTWPTGFLNLKRAWHRWAEVEALRWERDTVQPWTLEPSSHETRRKPQVLANLFLFWPALTYPYPNSCMDICLSWLKGLAMAEDKQEHPSLTQQLVEKGAVGDSFATAKGSASSQTLRPYLWKGQGIKMSK